MTLRHFAELRDLIIGAGVITVGNLLDNISPIPKRNPGYGAAHLYTGWDMQRKPCYYSIKNAINE
jgi:hypothetical protein